MAAATTVCPHVLPIGDRNIVCNLPELFDPQLTYAALTMPSTAADKISVMIVVTRRSSLGHQHGLVPVARDQFISPNPKLALPKGVGLGSATFAVPSRSQTQRTVLSLNDSIGCTVSDSAIRSSTDQNQCQRVPKVSHAISPNCPKPELKSTPLAAQRHQSLPPCSSVIVFPETSIASPLQSSASGSAAQSLKAADEVAPLVEAVVSNFAVNTVGSDWTNVDILSRLSDAKAGFSEGALAELPSSISTALEINIAAGSSITEQCNSPLDWLPPDLNDCFKPLDIALPSTLGFALSEPFASPTGSNPNGNFAYFLSSNADNIIFANHFEQTTSSSSHNGLLHSPGGRSESDRGGVFDAVGLGRRLADVANVFESNSNQSVHSLYSGGVATEIAKVDVMRCYEEFACSSAAVGKTESSNRTQPLTIGSLEIDPSDGSTAKECPFCRKSCSRHYDLMVHLRMHTGQKPFQCIVCGRAFAQNCNVRKHLESHRVWPHNAPLPSLETEQAFQNFSANRSRRSTADRLLIESLRSGRPLDSSALVKPPFTTSERFGGTSVMFPCPYCGVSLISHLALRAHIPRHADKKVYQCSLRSCRRLFADLSEFLQHLKLHEGMLTYHCPYCRKEYGNLHDVGIHQFSHTLDESVKKKDGKRERRYHCFDCSDRFSSVDALERHKAYSLHNYVCPNCPRKSFGSVRQLRVHLKQHLSVPLFRCKVCKRVFKSANSLQVHAVTHDIGRHVCSFCGKRFHRPFLLKRHIDSLHSDSAKFCCPQKDCGKCFRRADRYRDHLLSHTNHKPFKCSWAGCELAFGQRRHMTCHVQVVHLNNRKFSCSVCERRFGAKVSLTRHKCKPKKPEPILPKSE